MHELCRLFHPLAVRKFGNRTGTAHIDELFAFLMGETLVNNVLGALNIDFHNQFAALIAKGYHAGAVQHDGFGIRLYLKKLLQRCSIAQVAHALLDLFGNILRGFIARQNQCPALQAPRNKLAADLAAKVTGSTGDKI